MEHTSLLTLYAVLTEHALSKLKFVDLYTQHNNFIAHASLVTDARTEDFKNCEVDELLQVSHPS